MAITIKKGNLSEPVVYGADALSNGVEVKFGYGTLDKILNKVGTTDDGVIYFGYDEAKNTGAIVARGKMVSSKILDIKSTEAVVEDGKTTTEAQVVISYVDADTKTVKELSVPVSAGAKLDALSDRIKALEDTKYTKVNAKADGHVTVEVTADNVVTVKENDIASAELLGTKDDTKEQETAFGMIAKESDRATTAEGKLDTRVSAIETLMGDATQPDEDKVINKVVEVIDWFKDVSEDETGKSLIEDVAHNKAEIGVASTDSTEATGIHKRLEVLEAKKHTVSDVTATEGSYVSGVHVDENGTLTVDSTELKANGVAAEAIVAGDDTVAVEGDKVATQIASLAKSIKSAEKSATSAIEALDVTDTAVDGSYVSSVSLEDGKIKVERAELPKLSVKTGSENFVAVDNHEVEVKTSELGAVGLTKDGETGKWKAGTNNNATGLATAADVAGEIVSDEEVIATALNDHEERLKNVEAKKVTVDSADSDVAITVPAEENTNDETAFNVTGGKTTYTVQVDGDGVEKQVVVFNEKTIEALAKLYAKLDKRVTWLEVK